MTTRNMLTKPEIANSRNSTFVKEIFAINKIVSDKPMAISAGVR